MILHVSCFTTNPCFRTLWSEALDTGDNNLATLGAVLHDETEDTVPRNTGICEEFRDKSSNLPRLGESHLVVPVSAVASTTDGKTSFHGSLFGADFAAQITHVRVVGEL